MSEMQLVPGRLFDVRQIFSHFCLVLIIPPRSTPWMRTSGARIFGHALEGSQAPFYEPGTLGCVAELQ